MPGYYAGEHQTGAFLKAALGARLPVIMVPGRLVRLDAFPPRPNRKVDREALHALKLARSETSRTTEASCPGPKQGETAARSELREWLAAIQAEVLGVQGIGASDNFLDLGAHSLLAVQLHRVIRQELDVPTLSITDFFGAPVLVQMADRIAVMAGGSVTASK